MTLSSADHAASTAGLSPCTGQSITDDARDIAASIWTALLIDHAVLNGK